MTSSNPVAGGPAPGRGWGPAYIGEVIGIAKAYVTRVGAGPSPPSASTRWATSLVERGHEFGTNTGRRRRLGWFDAVMMRQAVRLNSLSEVALTKLDVLDTFDTVKVCVAYEAGRRAVHPPALPPVGLPPGRPGLRGAARVEEDLSGATELGDLPPAARDYVSFLAEQIGVPDQAGGGGTGPRAVRPLRRMTARARQNGISASAIEKVCVVGSGGGSTPWRWPWPGRPRWW